MPITLTSALPPAATLGGFTPAIPALAAMPSAFGIWDTNPESFTLVGEKVSLWNSQGGLATSFAQSTDSLRPVLDSAGRVSMGGTSRLDLSGVGTGAAFTLAFRFTSMFDTGTFQTIFAATGTSYARSFWKPDVTRTRFGDASGSRDVQSPPVPSGIVFVLNGNAISLHTGGQVTSWTSSVSSHVLTTLMLGAQTSAAAPDSHLRYSKVGIWRSALSAADLDNVKVWVGA